MLLQVVFLKVDVDASKDLSAQYEVSSMPTFLYLKAGKVLEKQAGASIDAVKGKIDQYA
jgi:suppressor of tumorigenicity protein 13